jgi:hypothetical protein
MRAGRKGRTMGQGRVPGKWVAAGLPGFKRMPCWKSSALSAATQRPAAS